jgi:hypothetical protein
MSHSKNKYAPILVLQLVVKLVQMDIKLVVTVFLAISVQDVNLVMPASMGDQRYKVCFYFII